MNAVFPAAGRTLIKSGTVAATRGLCVLAVLVVRLSKRHHQDTTNAKNTKNSSQNGKNLRVGSTVSWRACRAGPCGRAPHFRCGG